MHAHIIFFFKRTHAIPKNQKEKKKRADSNENDEIVGGY